jgi:hypothetical protein
VFAVPIIDLALPVAIASAVTASGDTNAALNVVSQTVSFVRASADVESPGDARDIVGYRLVVANANGDEQVVESRTLSSLGGSAGAAVTSAFDVSDLDVTGQITYIVYSFNTQGSALAGSSTPITDIGECFSSRLRVAHHRHLI